MIIPLMCAMNALIISSSDGMSLMLLRTLKAPDRKIFVFSIWEESAFSATSRYCAGFAAHRLDVCSDSAIAETLKAVNDYIAANGITILIPSGIWATYFMANYQSRLSAPSALPLPAPEVIYRLNNKWSFHELTDSLKIPTPATLRVTQSEDLKDHGIPYPVIIKPSIGGNSIGVVRCDKLAELEAYLKENQAVDREFLIQQFIPGKDVVFGFLALDGKIKAWTMHIKERRHLRFFAEARILQMAEKIIAHLGYSGPGNFDLMVLEDGAGDFYFLECNPRIWASFGVSSACGVDFFLLGNQLRQTGAHDASILTHVVECCEIPYPSSGKFIRSWFHKPYSPRPEIHTRLAWKTLLDPIPTIRQRLAVKNMETATDDTDMLDVLRNFLHSNS